MTDFFERVDELGIVENHIKGLEGLEEKEAKRILKRYREIRHELRDRLDSLPPGSFTAQRLRGVLAQVEAALSAMGSSLKDGVREPILNAATRGVGDLLGELKAFSKEFEGAVIPINLDALAVATDTRNFLVNQFDASIDAYTTQMRQVMTQGLTQAAIEEVSLAEVTRRLSQALGFEEWKLLRIGRTELHNVYNLGKMRSMTRVQELYLPDLKKTLIHPMDHRTGEDSKQLARKNLIVPIDEPFKFTYVRRTANGKTKKEERIFMAPPDRPNDRAILVPYREVWGKAA